MTSPKSNGVAGQAERATTNDPVFITDYDRTAQVRLSIEEHQRSRRTSLLDALAWPDGDDIAFDPAKLAAELSRPAPLT